MTLILFRKLSKSARRVRAFGVNARRSDSVASLAVCFRSQHSELRARERGDRLIRDFSKLHSPGSKKFPQVGSTSTCYMCVFFLF